MPTVMTQKKPDPPSDALTAARVALQIVELLEPVRSVKAKIALLNAAELMCDATALEGGVNRPRLLPAPDDAACDLCDQEADLEPGSFTPHEHTKRQILAAAQCLNEWGQRMSPDVARLYNADADRLREIEAGCTLNCEEIAEELYDK